MKILQFLPQGRVTLDGGEKNQGLLRRARHPQEPVANRFFRSAEDVGGAAVVVAETLTGGAKGNVGGVSVVCAHADWPFWECQPRVLRDHYPNLG